MKFGLIVSILFISNIWAQSISLKIISTHKNSDYDLSIGSQIELNFKEVSKTKKFMFLGRMVLNHGLGDEMLMLDEKTQKISFIDANQINLKKNISVQTIVAPMDQATETCGAFALYNFWNQFRESKTKESTNLVLAYSNERKRMQFLEEAISLYYISNQTDLNKILKKFGKRFDSRCDDMIYDDYINVQDYLFDKGTQGSPAIIEFWIGNNMFESTYQYTDYETEVEFDQRLWIPRVIGDRKKSGHMVVVAASFISRGQRKLLVLDSNWEHPRVWDLEKIITSRTAVKELIVHSCR